MRAKELPGPTSRPLDEELQCLLALDEVVNTTGQLLVFRAQSAFNIEGVQLRE